MLVDFNEISNDSRIWIYSSDKKLSPDQEKYISSKVSNHINNWQAHNNPLKASVAIFENYFIIVALDESFTKASGCSIDTLQNLVQQLEVDLKLSLLNRMNIYIKDKDEIRCIPLSDLKNYANSNTLFYDLTVNYKKDLITYLKPIKNSWCNSYI